MKALFMLVVLVYCVDMKYVHLHPCHFLGYIMCVVGNVNGQQLLMSYNHKTGREETRDLEPKVF